MLVSPSASPFASEGTAEHSEKVADHGDRPPRVKLWLLHTLAKELATLRLSFSCKMGVMAAPVAYSFYEDIMKKTSGNCLAHSKGLDQ